jgi:hypothetical protein
MSKELPKKVEAVKNDIAARFAKELAVRATNPVFDTPGKADDFFFSTPCALRATADLLDLMGEELVNAETGEIKKDGLILAVFGLIDDGYGTIKTITEECLGRPLNVNEDNFIFKIIQQIITLLNPQG